MKELEQYADLKAHLHVILMELAIIKQKQDPETELEDHVGQMLDNLEKTKNRMINEALKGKDSDWEFSV